MIGGGVALVGGAISANASGKAASQQAGAANRATDAQLQMFDTINQQQAPYRQAGYQSLDALLRGLGLGGGKTYGSSGSAPVAPTREQFTTTTPGSWAAMFPNGSPDPRQPNSQVFTPGSTSFDQAGYDKALAAFNVPQQQTGTAPVGVVEDGYFTHQFDANDLNDNLAPNYAFMRDQGLMATKNAGNLQTGLLSGNTIKGVNDYAMNYAGNAYQQAYNNYTANQSNIFNRLSSIAGLGQTANQATGQAGTTLAGNAGQSIMAGGQAQASGTVGQANAITGGLNNAMGWFTLPQLMNQNG